MYIVHVTSEATPFAKVGGLADVIMGLSRELTRDGHTVDVLLPNYDCIDKEGALFSTEKLTFKSYFDGGWYENSITRASYKEDFHASLIGSVHPRDFFRRGDVYGFSDDVDRFLYFSRAVLDFLKTQSPAPDIIHVHDWETAVIAALIREEEFYEHFKTTAVIFTIHNIEYQGWCSSIDVEKIGLKASCFQKFRIDGAINLLESGIVCADYVTTVSPNYAKEVLTPQGGRGLDWILKEQAKKFSGILNGIDTDYWDPQRDKYLEFRYSAHDISMKRKNKQLLQQRLGLSEDDSIPLIASITRLVPQKGMDLIEHAMRTAHGRFQFILLGSSHDLEVIQRFEKLKRDLGENQDNKIILQFHEDLAHKLYAASDICFVPSLFEPCGLVQLIALRYGSVPVVRKTGGLLDTIIDGENGFCFEYPDPQSVDWVLKRVLEYWKKKQEWEALLLRCMQCDFSWKKPAKEYLKVYTKAHKNLL